MSKKLRITATVTVPDDMFEQAAALADVKPALDALRQHISKIGPDAQVSADVVSPRGPRAPKQVD